MKDYQCRDAAAVMLINQIKESIPLYKNLEAASIVDNLNIYLEAYDATMEKLIEIEGRDNGNL